MDRNYPSLWRKEYVFVWRRERVKNVDDTPTMPYRPIHTMNNTAFQNGRPAAKLEKVRVYALRHLAPRLEIRPASTIPGVSTRCVQIDLGGRPTTALGACP